MIFDVLYLVMRYYIIFFFYTFDPIYEINDILNGSITLYDSSHKYCR